MLNWVSTLTKYLNKFLELGILLLAVSVIAEIVFGPNVAFFGSQVTKNLMGKMLGSMSDLHGDLWETVLGEEDSGISATPDRLDVPPVSTAWGEKTTLNNISTSPLNSSTKSKLSSLSDKDRIPLDRIARIMRGNDNLQSSVTSSITSSIGSSDEEKEESLEEITL